jgi:hypothetical protein
MSGGGAAGGGQRGRDRTLKRWALSIRKNARNSPELIYIGRRELANSPLV